MLVRMLTLSQLLLLTPGNDGALLLGDEHALVVEQRAQAGGSAEHTGNQLQDAVRARAGRRGQQQCRRGLQHELAEESCPICVQRRLTW